MRVSVLFPAALLASSALPLALALPLAAQDTTPETPPAPEPSYLESFLEENLSADNQYITVTGAERRLFLAGGDRRNHRRRYRGPLAAACAAPSWTGTAWPCCVAICRSIT